VKSEQVVDPPSLEALQWLEPANAVGPPWPLPLSTALLKTIRFKRTSILGNGAQGGMQLMRNSKPYSARAGNGNGPRALWRGPLSWQARTPTASLECLLETTAQLPPAATAAPNSASTNRTLPRRGGHQ
jgi:hypothetical protein